MLSPRKSFRIARDLGSDRLSSKFELFWPFWSRQSTVSKTTKFESLKGSPSLPKHALQPCLDISKLEAFFSVQIQNLKDAETVRGCTGRTEPLTTALSILWQFPKKHPSPVLATQNKKKTTTMKRAGWFAFVLQQFIHILLQIVSNSKEDVKLYGTVVHPVGKKTTWTNGQKLFEYHVTIASIVIRDEEFAVYVNWVALTCHERSRNAELRRHFGVSWSICMHHITTHVDPDQFLHFLSPGSHF